MRLDDFDPNINVEDQRGQGGGLGFGGGGGGGGMLFGLLPLVFSRFGCGGVVVLLILFAVFGGGLPSIIGGGSQLSAPTEQARPAQGRHRCGVELFAERPEQGSVQRLQFGRQDLGRAVLAQRRTLRPAQARLLWRPGPVRLRRSAERNGAILLPERPGHLSRHQLLRRARHAVRRERRFRAGLCDRARIRPSHPESARHLGSGAAADGPREPHRGQCPVRPAGAAGGLLCRRLGRAESRPDGTGRPRGRHDRRPGDRRRHVTERGAGPRRARQLHPWQLGAAHGLAQEGARDRRLRRNAIRSPARSEPA